MKHFALAGFVVGVTVSVLYCQFGEMGWFVPKPAWAQALFYPGLWVGGSLYYWWFNRISDWNLAVGICTIAGCVAEGVVFAAFAGIVGAVLQTMRRNA